MSEEKKQKPAEEAPKAEEKSEAKLSPELLEVQERTKGLLARRFNVEVEFNRAASEKKRLEKELETITADLLQCSRDFAAGGTKQTALPFAETKPSVREQLPPEDKTPRLGSKVTITAEVWSKLSEDDQRRIKHHAKDCGSALGEDASGNVVINGVPTTLKGTAFRALLAELGVAYTIDEAKPDADESKVRIMVRFAVGSEPDPGAWSRWIGSLGVRGIKQQQHEGGWISDPIQRVTKDYLELAELLRELGWQYEIIEAKQFVESPAVPPQLEAPVDPDVEGRKHLYAVYVRVAGSERWELDEVSRG